MIGAQTASQYVASLAGWLFFLGLNRYRILAVTPYRILVLDAGVRGIKSAKSVVCEVPRATRLGPGSGLWHVIPINGEKLRVHRQFFKDLQAADGALPVR